MGKIHIISGIFVLATIIVGGMVEGYWFLIPGGIGILFLSFLLALSYIDGRKSDSEN